MRFRSHVNEIFNQIKRVLFLHYRAQCEISNFKIIPISRERTNKIELNFAESFRVISSIYGQKFSPIGTIVVELFKMAGVETPCMNHAEK